MRSFDDQLVQGAFGFIFKQIDVFFPVSLPVAAAAIYDVPSGGEDETQAAYQKDVCLIACFLVQCDITGKGSSIESPKVGRSFPIQLDLEFPNIMSAVESGFMMFGESF